MRYDIIAGEQPNANSNACGRNWVPLLLTARRLVLPLLPGGWSCYCCQVVGPATAARQADGDSVVLCTPPPLQHRVPWEQPGI